MDPPLSPRGGAEGPSLLTSVVRGAVVVGFLGAVLFAVAGVWPPLVVVESESMSPNLRTGDLVFVTEPDRYAPASADAAGIVTAARADANGTATGAVARAGAGTGADGRTADDAGVGDTGTAGDYTRFGSPGDVVVFAAPAVPGPPVIHRARFHVEAGENWYDRADPDALPASIDSCRALRHCPAPHAGYVTKGDGNEVYDQVGRIPPVKPAWVRAKATARVPWLGWVRLVVTQGRVPATIDPVTATARGSPGPDGGTADGSGPTTVPTSVSAAGANASVATASTPAPAPTLVRTW